MVLYMWWIDDEVIIIISPSNTDCINMDLFPIGLKVHFKHIEHKYVENTMKGRQNSANSF